jgi:hypothetical protein
MYHACVIRNSILSFLYSYIVVGFSGFDDPLVLVSDLDYDLKLCLGWFCVFESI